MNATTKPAGDLPAKDQREALKDSVEKATQTQPGEFKDEANERKVVDIGDDVTDAPIKGIDP
jgi:hypothetical protein